MVKRPSRQEVGKTGEQQAALYLEKRGYRILERNWRCRSGELDLIAEADHSLVMIEVRSRTGSGFGTAAESIDARKINQVRSTAAIYVHQTGFHNQDRSLRFDVITVQFGRFPLEFEIQHIISAF
ncbi:YraN family protein [Paenibacillus sp. JX-17]|uniref:UPF0102 protein Q5741_05400 n=1 Tax=Paenibacillus lacisoli TaxID=3064525 RepID=A0ABT9C9E0_9BACL|nr:YraN family protein [Paenibacillus sp. JX-17]MDO7905851.1 YraN family protein [Paenibacillus sp. JX-17]